MTDTIDTETGEVIEKPKKKKKKNSKKKPGPINLFAKLKRAGSSIPTTSVRTLQRFF